MEEILLLIRIFLCAVLVLAGVGKLLDIDGSKKAVRDFGVPDELADGVAWALPVLEIGFGLMLLPLFTAWFGAIGAFVLLAVFIGGMIWQIAKGNAPDCHCFGAIHSEPVSRKSLVRNIVFASLAFALVAQGNQEQGLGLTELTLEMAIQLFFGIALVGLLGAVVFFLKKISEQQTQIMRRIEVLELISHEGGREVTRENLTAPEPGLPIGSRLPEFSLRDLSGRPAGPAEVVANGRPTLLLFLSPTCGPCAALLPDIEKWQNDLKEKLDFVIVSTGDAAANAEKFGGSTFKRIYLQNDREVAEMFSAQWTPAAVFVSRRGVVGSHPAVGDTAIGALVEKLKSGDLSNLLSVGGRANNTGLTVGDEVPEFELRDLDGREHRSADLKGRRTLLTYWSMKCGFCLQMMPDLIEWERTRGADDPELLLISAGTAEDHRDLTIQSPVLIDAEGATARKFGMDGTPSAIMIDENGMIVSEIALGAHNIWRLLGRPPKAAAETA